MAGAGVNAMLAAEDFDRAVADGAALRGAGHGMPYPAATH
jgi:hypothetical protein